ncbi:MAG TPA: hypothetical protein VFI04_03905 [Gaiellaceae bacterium]|nr:hypothetical protein [Gaiellaceae bacterium]
MKARRPAPQVGRRSASSGRASVTTKIGWLRDHSSRYSTKSSRLLVGPLQVLEDHHDRVGVRQPLEEQTPRREELLTLRLLAAAEAEQLR